jgi:hypothetical protein
MAFAEKSTESIRLTYSIYQKRKIMNQHKSAVFVCTLALLSGLFGCSKTENSNSSPEQNGKTPNLADATSPQAVEQAKVKALPQGNPDTPLSQYRELTSDKDVMFTYYALSSLPVDYDKILANYSQDYKSTSDEFKKQDIQKALKPKVDQEIANAKASTYIKMKWDQFSLDKYDFQAKGFPQNKLTNNVNFGWGYDYRIEFTNGDEYKLLKVADEAKARIIEEKRSKYQQLDLIIYAFIQDTAIDQHHVKVQIQKVVLVDKNGTELF